MMHDPNDVWIEAKVKETKINSLRVGQPVAISVDARPDIHYSGHVQVIGGAATNQFALLPDPNPSGNFTKITQRIPVRIAIDHGPRPKLAPGMMVEVDIDITGNGHPQQHPIRTRQEQLAPAPKTPADTQSAGDTAERQQPEPSSAAFSKPPEDAPRDRVVRSGLQLSPARQLN